MLYLTETLLLRILNLVISFFIVKYWYGMVIFFTDFIWYDMIKVIEVSVQWSSKTVKKKLPPIIVIRTAWESNEKWFSHTDKSLIRRPATL